MQININNLNTLELNIHQQLQIAITNDNNLKITQAAEICQVSTSKISKFCQKIGFINYKQYKNYISTGKIIDDIRKTPELIRLEKYLKKFDQKKVDKLAKLINQHKRIILHGVGPSLIAVEYFAYRLRLNCTQDIITTSEEFFITNNINNSTLVIIYTATGSFKSFNQIINDCRRKDTQYIIICEENNHIRELKNAKIIYLTNTHQKEKEQAFEKTRTLWFIYLEEVITKLNKK